MQQDVYGAAGRGRELLPAGQLPQQTNHPGHQACQVGIVFVIMHKIGLPIQIAIISPQLSKVRQEFGLNPFNYGF